jgi:hypothetical protein
MSLLSSSEGRLLVHQLALTSFGPIRIRLAGLLAVSLLAAACGSANPSATPAVAPTSAATEASSAAAGSPGPSSSPISTSGWIRATNIEEPDGFMTAQTGVVITRGCAPCHPAIDTLMTGVTSGPAGLVTVGWILQDFSGASWLSSDANTWKFTGGFPAQTLLSAVAANSQRYEAVGRDGDGATPWTTTDGKTWQKVSSPAFSDHPLRLTAITPWKGGFVAGGYRGNEFFSADADLWVSPDGLTWQEATDSPSFKDARVWGVAANGNTLVAVGQTGSTDTPGPAIVWTSSDGRTWTRVPDGPVFAGGRMRAVASVSSIGFVAVGEDLAGDTGRVWTSKDGRAWTLVPSESIFGRPGIQVRMYDVTDSPSGVVVGGTINAGVQYGEAAIWTSPDGLAWSRTPDGPEFLDNEITASTRWNERVVAVGDRGAPDAYQATTWLSPLNLGQ